MKAVLIKDSSNHLYIGDSSEPQLGDNDLLVSVKATALNRADIAQKNGMYPPPKGESDILGLEMAGAVEKVGRSVQDWEVGDRVFALLPGGGYAEKVVIPAGMAMRIPDNLSYTEAAAIPEAYLTAFLNLSVLAGVKAGEHVLIHAGASGVGTAAIQLVREWGAISVVTAGSEKKLNVCKNLGAEYLINYKDGDFSNGLVEFTSNKGVDVILDPVGASMWQENMNSISTDGRWIFIGGLGGYLLSEVNLLQLLFKRIHFIGSTLRARSKADKIELTKKFFSFAEEKFKNGKLIPVIDQVMSWHDVNEAHQVMEANKNIGKIVLKID
ncbi:NAD(P)H-quinone oxidoreductase [Bacillus sp. B15-48]|uniref:NAD(P)H-quinone oxidoreductase n=1 Tax=Bacillus sp. B15-48 TaxID=1548601 RepID=UPI00193F1F8F|nr:NAD(P)H-quinone oxidoreductase [Bacillus sp. B15-48]MBM4763319.1 zinc-binding dehydrogenase [Bacillus sp. B15-48]